MLASSLSKHSAKGRIRRYCLSRPYRRVHHPMTVSKGELSTYKDCIRTFMSANRMESGLPPGSFSEMRVGPVHFQPVFDEASGPPLNQASNLPDLSSMQM